MWARGLTKYYVMNNNLLVLLTQGFFYKKDAFKFFSYLLLIILALLIMSVTTFADLERYFSAQRLQRYLVACGGNNDRAVDLYKANIRMSQSFHPLLCLFETVIRNKINQVLTAHFSDSGWILNQQAHFMSHISLGRKYYLRTEVDKTVQRLRRGGFTVNSGKVIADLTFGFWSALFEPRHYSLLLGKPIHIFPRLPSGINRLYIYNNLTIIRDFRNRVSHSEPICFNVNNISFHYAIQNYRTIFRLLRWVDVNLPPFISEFDTVISEIKHAKNI
jgi:hypothetical protein